MVIVDRGAPSGPCRFATALADLLRVPASVALACLPLFCRLLTRSYVLVAYAPRSLGPAIIARGSDILGPPRRASAWWGRLIREGTVFALVGVPGLVGQR
jgi:hypothetical protein